jgi:hypothetical protein
MRETLANVMEHLPKAARKKIEDEQEAEEESEDEEPAAAVSAFESWSDDELRAYIKERTGTGVRGQPAHATLVKMAEEASLVEPKQSED